MASEPTQGAKLKTQDSQLKAPPQTFFVRLKPFDPRHGQTLRRYTFQGIRFRADRGWCRVEEEVAAHLRRVRSRSDDPRAPLAFDVCTEGEARAIEAQEVRDQSVSRAVIDALPVTTSRSRGKPARVIRSTDKSASPPPPLPESTETDDRRGGKRKKRKGEG